MSDVSPGDVKDTAVQQARRVGDEARVQARSVAADVRDRFGDQARTQNTRLVGGIRQTADHLDEMRGQRQDTPAASVVGRVADGGRQLADYLERNGPEGVLREVQDFARRRPGAFLAAAIAAGFVVGRLGKGVVKADQSGKPASDSFVSGGAYPAGGVSAADYRTGAAGASAADYRTGASAADYQTGAAGASGGYVPETGTLGTGGPAVATGYGAGSTTEYASTGTGRPIPVEEQYAPRDPEARP